MTIKELVYAAHNNSVSKGFWDEDVWNLPEKHALIHSEVSEALEEVRKPTALVSSVTIRQDGKPEGFPTELADIVIRVADLCGQLNIDLDEVIRMKMTYNATRPHKHGKAF
jgi:NTP pyrophosphatase (non-canonical NTP hydrolase)